AERNPSRRSHRSVLLLQQLLSLGRPGHQFRVETNPFGFKAFPETRRLHSGVSKELPAPSGSSIFRPRCLQPKPRPKRVSSSILPRHSPISFEREDPHLCWRPHLGVLRPDREKAHRIPESVCHPVCPVQEFLSRPLEAVIAVAQLSDGH